MTHPKIPSLPRGWEIIRSAQSREDPRQALVMCKRLGSPTGNRGTEYVVWRANTIEGGCFWGFYTDDLDKAISDFSHRSGREALGFNPIIVRTE